MIVGNDIVDLRDAGEPSPRFVRRVLAADERAADARAVWRRWAAKEAAYKVLSRRAPDLPFAHARFVVDVDAGLVRHEGAEVRVRWEDRDGAVACVGWQGAGELVHACATVDGASPGELSLAVRRLAVRSVCERLGFDPAEVENVEIRGRPPEVWWRGARLPGVAVSLSHDGRFVSCALGLEVA